MPCIAAPYACKHPPAFSGGVALADRWHVSTLCLGLSHQDDELSEARTRVSQLESEVASTSAELESIRQRADAATRSGGDMRQYISEKEAQLKVRWVLGGHDSALACCFNAWAARLRKQELSDAAKKAQATIDAYASREKALEKRFLELDVFKLDSVATAMKKVDEVRSRCRYERPTPALIALDSLAFGRGAAGHHSRPKGRVELRREAVQQLRRPGEGGAPDAARG